ncbi:hypothetical protein ASG77_11885 [Arthrobacter sp. Soil762]|nr:hypothetical protein ASG77_11885 [Arthrobacter sp. Soil762]
MLEIREQVWPGWMVWGCAFLLSVSDEPTELRAIGRKGIFGRGDRTGQVLHRCSVERGKAAQQHVSGVRVHGDVAVVMRSVTGEQRR